MAKSFLFAKKANDSAPKANASGEWTKIFEQKQNHFGWKQKPFAPKQNSFA